MIIFLSALTIFVTSILLLVMRIWSVRPNDAAQENDDPDWQVLLAKRNELERDALIPQHTKNALRLEWSHIANAVLSRKKSGDVHANKNWNGSRKRPWVIALLSCTFALAVYVVLGRWDGDALLLGAQTSAQSPGITRDLPVADGARHPGDTESIENRIAKLEQKLKEAPTDLDGWVLLSRSRGIQRDFTGASAALEQALALAPGHPDLLADLADVLGMTANRSLAGRPSQLIEQALQKAPDHRKALSLAATASMQMNDLLTASGYWRRLRATFPENAPDVAQIDAILANIGAAGISKPEEKKVSTTSSPSEARIEGQVELSPQMIAHLKKHGLPATAKLFVLARVPSGPPMPIAVARFSPQDLADGKKISFKLDDSQAMTPALKLSGTTHADIEARISMTGTAARQTGDLVVTNPGVKVGVTDLHLVIQSVLP